MSAGADWAAGTAARRERSIEESQSPGSLVITEIPLGSSYSDRLLGWANLTEDL